MQAGALIEFDVRTPATKDKLARNVGWALRACYDEVEAGADKAVGVDIIANGPSARLAPLNGFTVALNGAMGLFREKGIAPIFWAGCDPQPLMADFLRGAPLLTTYLVASKCDRSVFNALARHDVRLWHIDDSPGVPWGVPTATSITLVALSLLRRMGYREFRVWGWDGCYLDGLDHAIPQAHRGEDVTVEVNGRPFHTTTTWAVEAQDAVNQLSDADYTVHIEGDGMVKAIVGALVPRFKI